jgi:hypothetical protein
MKAGRCRVLHSWAAQETLHIGLTEAEQAGNVATSVLHGHLCT